MDNANTKEYLDKIRRQVAENLKRTAFAPSIQMTDVPRDPIVGGMDDEADEILDDLDEDENKDKRVTKRRFDQYVEKPGELSESEDEDEAAANGVRRQPGAIKRRNHVTYRNLDVTDSGVDSGLATPKEASSAAGDDMDVTGGDTRMGEAPEAATAESHSPAPHPPADEPTAEPAPAPPSTSEHVAAPEPAGAAERGVSTLLSHQYSPPAAQGEDTPMEDVRESPAPKPMELSHEEKHVPEPSQPEPEKQPEPQTQPASGPAPELEQEQPRPAPSPEKDERKPENPASEQRAPEEESAPAVSAEPATSKSVPESKEKTSEEPKEGLVPSSNESDVQPPKEPTVEQSETPAKEGEA